MIGNHAIFVARKLGQFKARQDLADMMDAQTRLYLSNHWRNAPIRETIRRDGQVLVEAASRVRENRMQAAYNLLYWTDTILREEGVPAAFWLATKGFKPAQYSVNR